MPCLRREKEGFFFLSVDVYFLDVLNDPRTQDEEAIQVLKDGSWRLVEKSTVEADKTVEVLSSSDDESGSEEDFYKVYSFLLYNSEEEASDSSQSKTISTIDLTSSPIGPKRNLKRSLSVEQPSTSSATPGGGGGGKKKKAGTSPKPPERKRGQTSHQKGAEKTELESTTARRKKGGTEERNEKTLRNGKCYG